MSLCLATKAGGAAIGIAGIAQIVPSRFDAVGAANGVYSSYGVVGLAIAAVVLLWIDGKREAAKAEERRAKRDEKDDARQESFIRALGEITATLREGQVKCDATRELVRSRFGKPEQP